MEGRLNDLRRIEAAPEEIFREYCTGETGYRVALNRTRGYLDGQRAKSKWKRRQLRRAAGRLIDLAKVDVMSGDGWEYELKGFKVRVFRL